MFYIAEALLLTKDVSYSKHSGVLSGFWEHFVKNGTFSRELHKSFHQAFDERNVGDYGYDIVVPKAKARKLLENAHSFLESGIKYLKQNNT